MSEVFLQLLKEAATKGVEKCLEETFVKVDGETRLLDAENTGSTACIAFITIENKERILYIANVGDTRAILINAGGVQRLSYEHKAIDSNEVLRIQYKFAAIIRKSGGFVMSGRAGGQLAISRSIGDHSLRDVGVIPNPSTQRVIIRPTDSWIVMATDGVWDSLTDKEVEELVKIKDEPANKMAQKIIKAAMDKGSQDNITCLVIKL